MTAQPIFLDLKASIALDTPVDATRLERGTPMTGVLVATENTTKKFHTGQWRAEAGAWRVSYDEEELCVILSGSGLLISDDGSRFPFKAGDAFVIPAGFSGLWDNAEEVRKIYAIVE